MKRTLIVAFLCLAATACNRKPITDDNKPRPGETIEARVFLPDHWTFSAKGDLSVVFEVRRPGRAEPIKLQAADLPAEFQPEIVITFEKDGQATGQPARIGFNADC